MEFDRQTILEVGGLEKPITEGIVSGSLYINEILSQKNLDFGAINSNRFECQVYGIPDLSNNYIAVFQVDNDVKKRIFTGYIESCKSDTSRRFRTIVAYDCFYQARNLQVSDWWYNYWQRVQASSTLKDVRNNLLEYAHIPYVDRPLPNDNADVHQWITDSSILLKDLLKDILELQCCFANVDRQGKLEFIMLDENERKNILNYNYFNENVNNCNFGILSNPNTYDSYFLNNIPTADTDFVFDRVSLKNKPLYFAGSPQGSESTKYGLFIKKSMGSEPLTYQWQYRSRPEYAWNDSTPATTGYNTNKLSVRGAIGRNGYQYRCRITDDIGMVVYSNISTLKVQTCVISNHPSNIYVLANDYAMFAVGIQGTAKSYQWQWSADNGITWRDSTSTTAGYNTNSITVQGTTSRNGYKYRCKITDDVDNIIYSNPATLSVMTNTSSFIIRTQPQSCYTTIGNPVILNCLATGPELIYHWHYSEDGGNTWWEVPEETVGYNTSTIKVFADREIEYRCQIISNASVNYAGPAKINILEESPYTVEYGNNINIAPDIDFDGAYFLQNSKDITILQNKTAEFYIDAVKVVGGVAEYGQGIVVEQEDNVKELLIGFFVKEGIRCNYYAYPTLTVSIVNNLDNLFELNNSLIDEYPTENITSVKIYKNNELRVIAGIDNNNYELFNNFIASNGVTADIFRQHIANRMIEKLQNYKFVPLEIKMIVSDFGINVGDIIKIGDITSYVLEQSFSGTQFVEQKIIAKGDRWLTRNIDNFNL